MPFIHPPTSLLFALYCFFSLSFSIQLWSSPGALPTNIPASCRAELSKNITCSPVLVSAQFAAGGRAMDPKTAAQYCTSSCYNSLQVNPRSMLFGAEQLLIQNSLSRPMWICAVEIPCIRCIQTALICNLEPPSQIRWLGHIM